MPQAIRSVKRALSLLRIMNAKPVWSLRELTHASGLPKPSVFRLLQTLEEDGCVRSAPGARGLYRLSSSVCELASGLTPGSILADVAAPAIIAGTRRIRWPLSLAVLDDCYMRVVFCGMPYSTLAPRATTVNRRFWMFTSALGRAYFSFCHPVERQVLLERASALLSAHDLSWPYTQQQLLADTRKVRADGYSVRWAGKLDPTSAVAVPIGGDDSLLGSVVCSIFAKSLTQRRIDELAPALGLVADEILTRWRRRNSKVFASETQ
jgi:IclR family transcriptional regulator, mhp operon transcriptional activator